MICPKCTQHTTSKSNCSNCAYPINGSQKDIKLYERQLRNVRYAVEDYQTANSRLSTFGLGILILAGIMLFSIFFQAKNIPFFVTSLLYAGMLIAANHYANWTSKKEIYIAMSIAFSFIFFEFLIFGLPDPIVPGLIVVDNYGHRDMGNMKAILIFIFNDGWPFLYFFLKLTTIYAFFALLKAKDKRDSFPENMLLSYEK